MTFYVAFFFFVSIIGIKHGFLCINICWAPREALKPVHERRVFQSSRNKAQQMLMHQKDRYYCIMRKFGEIFQILQKFMSQKWRGKMTLANDVLKCCFRGKLHTSGPFLFSLIMLTALKRSQFYFYSTSP